MTDDFRELAERLDAILESSVDGILAIDEHGLIEYANSSALAMFGYTSDESIGESVNLLMDSPDRELHDGYIKRYLETGIPSVIGIGREVDGLRKDGTVFPHYLTISEGKHRGRTIFTGVVRDLTEIRRTEERAKSAEQLASLSLLSAGIVHDVGTPMNVILGYSEMLRDSLENPKDQRRAGVIVEQVRRVSDLLRTLLDLSRPSAPERTPVAIEGVLEHALEFFREKLSKRMIDVDRRFEAVPEIIGVRDRLEQAFLNLIVNAADAMPKGGKLAVTLSSGLPGFVDLEIRDTGEGMDEETLSRIFDPFYTTKERGQGTGLGLVVTQSIISDHQGTIECDSELGKGTRFRIRFPAAVSEG